MKAMAECKAGLMMVRECSDLLSLATRDWKTPVIFVARMKRSAYRVVGVTLWHAHG